MKRTLLTILCILTSLFSLYSQDIINGHYKKALVIGAHPDDPETMAGGTILKLKEQGCEVVVVYLTRGEAGIRGKSHQEAAAIRAEEGKKSCEYMGVRLEFLSQIDGATVVNAEAYKEMENLLKKENPDLIITHWPIDGHRDHRNCGILVFDAWNSCNRTSDLYYAEVMTGHQSLNFAPDSYVDITSVKERKVTAYLMHESQKLVGEVTYYHDTMEAMRGIEYDCKYAESFIRQTNNRQE